MNMEQCKDCDMWTIGNDDDGECHLNPPTVHIVMAPVKTLQGDGMQAQILSLFPRTRATSFCSNFITYAEDTGDEPESSLATLH